ncbi:MAG: phosphodiester glycosidase family protein [Gemmatimonas sp.]
MSARFALRNLPWSALAPAVALTLSATGPHLLWAQRTAPKGDTLVSEQLAPGVEYRQFQDKSGPWRVNLVRIDLRVAKVELRPARANDSLRSREKTTGMVQRANSRGDEVLAAVNADFFELKLGENENNQVINGEWWKGLKVTDSPYDTYDNVHIQFGIDADRHVLMDRFILDGRFWARGAMTPIVTVNSIPSGTYEGTTLFTPKYGARTPLDTARKSVEVALQAAGLKRDTLLFVRRGAAMNSNGNSIPANGAILSAYGPRADALKATNEGDTVRVLLATLPRIKHGATPTALIGGWPRILKNGVNVAGEAATVEGTLSRNAEAVHPRTAVGFSRDSSRVYLLTVDGRSENSGGATLVQLAGLMKKLGAWDAMNFDGGGSTTMVIRDKLVNVPSDTTGERAVGNALLLIRRK